MNGIKMKRALQQKIAQTKMVYNYLTETAEKFPDKIAIVSIGLNGEPDRTLTFRELEEYINQIANYFLSCGLQKGDCVAVFLENSPESYAVYLGLAKIGVISSMINTNLRSNSLTHCLKICKCVGLVFSSHLGEAVCGVLPELDPALREQCYCVGGHSTVPEAKRLEDVLGGVSKQPPPPVKDRSVFGEAVQSHVLNRCSMSLSPL